MNSILSKKEAVLTKTAFFVSLKNRGIISRHMPI
jgi:hypothetical protein